MERECKLRQALTAMGLHDLAYWLSWHLYQSALALLGAASLYPTCPHPANSTRCVQLVRGEGRDVSS
jgi:hypothetical protein